MSSEPKNLGVLMREPFRVASEELHEYFAAHGHGEVRTVHGNVLQFLDGEGTRVSELARRAQMTKQSMAELVAYLERRGYVERVPDPADRRAKLVRATARGEEVYALAREFVALVEARWEQVLGARGLAQLRRQLEKLNDALP